MERIRTQCYSTGEKQILLINIRFDVWPGVSLQLKYIVYLCFWSYGAMDIWLHYQTARITTESLTLVCGQAGSPFGEVARGHTRTERDLAS